MLDSIFTVWTRQTWEATENKDTTGELYNSQGIIPSLGWSFYHTGIYKGCWEKRDFGNKNSDDTVFPATNMLKCWYIWTVEPLCTISGSRDIKITIRTTTSERKQVFASNSKFQKKSNRLQVTDKRSSKQDFEF